MSHQTKSNSGWVSVLPSLIVPVCLGMSLYIGMLALIRQGVIDNETVLRYLTGHPVSKVSVAMFFIGGSSLLMIALNVFAQFAAERQIAFRKPTDFELEQRDKSDDAELAIELGQQLLDYPKSLHSHYLWQRLTNALHFVYRNGSAAGVDEEIKYQADLDVERQQQRYSLVQILIWATPMLGFLGTVLGISQALGGISVGPDNDFQQMMDGLRGSLYVAFDTTALALTLSMILMFAQFLVDRFETQLLSIVDRRARSEIASQYDFVSGHDSMPTELANTVADSVAESVQHLGREMLGTTQKMVAAQTEIWKKTIHAAENAWSSSVNQTNEQVRQHFTDSIEQTVMKFSTCLDDSIHKADHSMTRRWEQWQVMLSDNARLLSEHQNELSQQTASMERIAGQASDQQQLADAMQKNSEAITATAALETSIRELARTVEAMQTRVAQSPIPPVQKLPLVGPDREPVGVPAKLLEPSRQAKRTEFSQAEVILPLPTRNTTEMPLRPTKRSLSNSSPAKHSPNKRVA